MSKRKYREYCYSAPKRFFFWGIFRNKEEVELQIGFKPSLFIDGTLEMNGKTIKGKIAEFDVPNEMFFYILGRLALIESNNYILSTRYNYAISSLNGKEYHVLVYIYAKRMKHLRYYY